MTSPAEIEAAARALYPSAWSGLGQNHNREYARSQARAALTAAAQVQPADCPSCGARTYVETPAGCRSPESHHPQPAPRTVTAEEVDDILRAVRWRNGDPVYTSYNREAVNKIVPAVLAALGITVGAPRD